MNSDILTKCKNLLNVVYTIKENQVSLLMKNFEFTTIPKKTFKKIFLNSLSR